MIKSNKLIQKLKYDSTIELVEVGEKALETIQNELVQYTSMRDDAQELLENAKASSKLYTKAENDVIRWQYYIDIYEFILQAVKKLTQQ